MNAEVRTQPAVFISHGSPMVAIETGPYQDALAAFGATQKPTAIVVVSAHWESGSSISITSAERHSLIYDFGGFPRALYNLKYDAPGDPQLAKRISNLLSPRQVTLDASRGLDHGAWVPLRLMFPAADVPVVELSIPADLPPQDLFAIGSALAPLRGEGILVMGSGGIVHNLRLVDFQNKFREPEEWAKQFDDWFARAVKARDYHRLFDYEDAQFAKAAIPTPEHFVPVFVVLGAAQNAKSHATIYEGFEHGTISMRSFALV